MKLTSYLPLIFALLTYGTSGLCQDFEVAPVKLQFNVEPGETRSRIITLKNHENKPQTYVVSIGDFLINIKYLPANSTAYSCAEWLNINPTFFELQPNEEKEIAVSLQVPVGEFSTKWSVLFFGTAVEQDVFSVDQGVTAGVTVSSRIAVQIYQSPSSNANISAVIEDMKEITTAEDTARKFVATIQNTGEKILNCKVYLIATNLETAEEDQYEPVLIRSFPKTSRLVELTLPNNLSKGNYALAAILDYGSMSNLEGTQIIIKVE